jgi:hypothetical protein
VAHSSWLKQAAGKLIDFTKNIDIGANGFNQWAQLTTWRTRDEEQEPIQ